ncbi:uncharacterized protein E5676_scaffold852G00450 [Cucumis melo var. makuwa]|uniref:Uncharacterized protein n=1 Tax=Cucumis melo var. makuwa TaxID=1194695 RepID=A0A5D3C8I8_CUCMM|nr:uncharacterized protein E6C27_scaffold1779G00220 [Cucumis melo var. makuwa]TYK07602.1 uncharacterized protein E5676_scaffold852G00450 [Cucumis melo var. makuwa]
MLAWVSFEITTYLGLCSPTGRQSSMDIDMIRVARRGPRIPIDLVSPPGSLQTIGIRAQCFRFCRLTYEVGLVLFGFILTLWLYGPSSLASFYWLNLGRMPPHKGARRGGGRGGRGAGRGQPEEQPAVPAVDPNAPVT